MIILILAGLAAYAGWVSAPKEVESRASVLVVPPWSFESAIFPNPMLNLADRTTALATTMVAAVQTSDVRENIMEAGATDFQVTNLAPDSLRDPTRSSVLQIVVKGPNEQAAHAGAGRVIDQSRLILKRMQEDAGVGESPYWANLQVIVPPEETTSAGTRQVRGAAAFGAAVFIIGALLVWTVESILERRSRSRSGSRSRDGGSEFVTEHDGAANAHADSTATPIVPASSSHKHE
jgi:hypothetical protein